MTWPVKCISNSSVTPRPRPPPPRLSLHFYSNVSSDWEQGGWGGAWRLIFLSSGLEIVKSSSCQRHRWPWWLWRTTKKDLRASVVSSVCVGSEVCCFCFELNNGPLVGPHSAPGLHALFNRDTRWSLMCAALREKRRHVLLLLCGPAASFTT